MPGLDHWPNRPAEFDPKRSEVLAWIREQDAILIWIMERLCDRGLIAFDQTTKRWQGVPSVPADEPEHPAEYQHTTPTAKTA